jgi:poly(A) polymerase
MRMAEDICQRLRLSNHERERVAALVGNHMKFSEVKKMRVSTLKRFLRSPEFPELLELHRMDCLASHRDLSLYEFCRQKLAEMSAEQIRPRPWLGGNDLIAAGYEPGPRFKQMLAAAEDAQLEGKVKSKQEALAFVQQEFPP